VSSDNSYTRLDVSLCLKPQGQGVIDEALGGEIWGQPSNVGPDDLNPNYALVDGAARCSDT